MWGRFRVFQSRVLGLPPSPVSLLCCTALASFSFGSLAECLTVFRMYFAFLASLRLIVSWFIIVFLSLCFPFPYSFYLGLFIWLLCMQSFLGEGFFARFRLNCFSSLRIVHPWELAAITSFHFPVVFAPFLSSHSFA